MCVSLICTYIFLHFIERYDVNETVCYSYANKIGNVTCATNLFFIMYRH